MMSFVPNIVLRHQRVRERDPRKENTFTTLKRYAFGVFWSKVMSYVRSSVRTGYLELDLRDEHLSPLSCTT
jgi:hypothetical protein